MYFVSKALYQFVFHMRLLPSSSPGRRPLSVSGPSCSKAVVGGTPCESLSLSGIGFGEMI